jgi:arylformamidase
MTQLDLEAEYNNRARVPEHPQIFQRWTEAAAKFRAGHKNSEQRISYGPGERQYIDLFWPSTGRDAPVVLFIHGGYWRALDPSRHSHFAAGVNAHGLAMAFAGYDLCPNVSIAEIIGQIQAAAIFLGRRIKRRIVVTGHSAGGHLTACAVATNWKQLAPDLPDNFVPAGLSISGLFDLEPMLHVSMNEDLRLKAEDIREVSPLFWPVAAGRTLDAWVGASESNEFLRHSRQVADEWGRRGVNTRYVEAPGNHFTVLDPLNDPQSKMTRRLQELAAKIA